MTTVKYWTQHRDNGEGNVFCGQQAGGESWGDWGEVDCRECLRVGAKLGLYKRKPGWKRKWPRRPKTRRPR